MTIILGRFPSGHLWPSIFKRAIFCMGYHDRTFFNFCIAMYRFGSVFLTYSCVALCGFAVLLCPVLKASFSFDVIRRYFYSTYIFQGFFGSLF
jgi:hypothetical protein